MRAWLMTNAMGTVWCRHLVTYPRRVLWSSRDTLFKKILLWFFISLLLRLYFHLAFYPLKTVWQFCASFTTQLNILWGINHLLNNVHDFLCKNNQTITSSLCIIPIRISWIFLLQYASLYIFFLPHFYSYGSFGRMRNGYVDFFKLFKTKKKKIRNPVRNPGAVETFCTVFFSILFLS